MTMAHEENLILLPWLWPYRFLSSHSLLDSFGYGFFYKGSKILFVLVGSFVSFALPSFVVSNFLLVRRFAVRILL